MAKCLHSFAERDVDIVTRAITKTMNRLETADPGVQLRALGRLGHLPAFWASLAEPVRNLLISKMEKIGDVLSFGVLKPEEAVALALVAHPGEPTKCRS